MKSVNYNRFAPPPVEHPNAKKQRPKPDLMAWMAKLRVLGEEDWYEYYVGKRLGNFLSGGNGGFFPRWGISEGWNSWPQEKVDSLIAITVAEQYLEALWLWEADQIPTHDNSKSLTTSQINELRSEADEFRQALADEFGFSDFSEKEAWQHESKSGDYQS